jgi:hypothetical protein
MTGQLGDTRNPAVRAALARGLSAATTRADKQGAFHHAEVPASAAEHLAAAVVGAAAAAAGITNRRIVISPMEPKIQKMEKAIWIGRI